MRAREILQRLERVKLNGKGWMAKCPTHDDHNPSLSINEGQDGRVLLNCFAGCQPEAICRTLGITLRDLMSNRHLGGSNGSHPIAAEYDYRDENGALLYQVIRLHPKDFRQRRPDGNGGYIWNLSGTRRVLYRLPELLSADTLQVVFVTEGEKDADRLNELGLAATTNAGGAGKWRESYNAALQSRAVVILADNDPPGREHARNIARSINSVAASVRILELPDLPEKGDISDWLDGGGTREHLVKLAAAAPEWKSPLTEAKTSGEPDEGLTLPIVCMAKVEPETVRWLWKPYVPLGKLTILEGDPGAGKSWLTCALAAAVSTGRGLPGAGDFEPGKVLMLSAEDGLGDTLRPRLDAAGANRELVYALAGPLTLDAEGLSRLDAALVKYDPDLVTIDPLFAYTGPAMDMHRANECRAVTAAIAAMLADRNCALIAIRHLSKSRGLGHALNAGLGSIDITAAARSVLLVGADPDDSSRRALVHSKSNLAPHGPAIGYIIGGGKFYWTGQTDLTASRILSFPNEERASAAEDAMTFLRNELAEGPKPKKDIESRAGAIRASTLRRARERLKIKVKKEGGRFGGAKQFWTWELPPEGAEELPEDDQQTGNEHVQVSEANKALNENGLPEDAPNIATEHLQAMAAGK